MSKVAGKITTQAIARASLSVGIAVYVLSAGCSQQETAVDLVRHQLQVGSHTVTIALPEEFQPSPWNPETVLSRIWYRNPRELRLSHRLPNLGDRTRTVTLGRDRKLRYSITQWVGAGSGGPEAELVGHLSIEEVAIGVIARDQDEFSPHPEWCIKYLKTVQVQ